MTEEKAIQPERIPGDGWIALIGGGEFSFGDTEDADRAWLDKIPPEGRVGFLPTASGSSEYGGHFANYLRGRFGREVDALPIYRGRDVRRSKNCERIAACDAVYIGGGLVDNLAVLDGTPVLEALRAKLEGGGVIVAMASAAQWLGHAVWSPRGHHIIDGLGWLPGGVLETNFEPDQIKPLRKMLRHPGARWGLALAASSAVLLGGAGEVETTGEVFVVGDPGDGLQSLPSPRGQSST